MGTDRVVPVVIFLRTGDYDRIDIAGSVLNAIGYADYSLSGMHIQGNEVDGGMGKRV